MSQTKPFTVAIVGGGIVGTVLAIALHRRNIRAQLYERGDSLNEIGASLGLNYSAIQALKLCGPDLVEAHDEVGTIPIDPESFMELRDGFNDPSSGGYTIPWDDASTGVHRGQFLEALIKRLPAESVSFGKSLETIEEHDGEPVKLIFKDGSTATADAVIGADGIGSHARRYLLGEDHPATRVHYSHQYAYRAVLNASDAPNAADTKINERIILWLGKNGHLVTVPIAHGKMLGLNAVVRDPAPWPSEHKMVLPAEKDDVIKFFSGFGPDVRTLVGALQERSLDRWALFDSAENPIPFLSKGRVALAGDAAHATTPHLGSGAGFGIEDAAVLAELLADERMQGTAEHVEAAFAAYNEARLARDNWLPKNSRAMGDLLDFVSPGVEGDMKVIEEKSRALYNEAWSGPVYGHAKAAKESFGARLQKLQTA